MNMTGAANGNDGRMPLTGLEVPEKMRSLLRLLSTALLVAEGCV
jgi:hypothetical protein